VQSSSQITTRIPSFFYKPDTISVNQNWREKLTSSIIQLPRRQCRRWRGGLPQPEFSLQPVLGRPDLNMINILLPLYIIFCYFLLHLQCLWLQYEINLWLIDWLIDWLQFPRGVLEEATGWTSSWEAVPAGRELHLFIPDGTIWCMGIIGTCLCLQTCCIVDISCTLNNSLKYCTCTLKWQHIVQ